MNDELVVFYINRDADTERRVSLEEKLAHIFPRAERISAVNGRQLPTELEPFFPPSSLKPGEVGCYASHMLVWNEIVGRRLRYALILEDDVDIDIDVKALISEILTVLPRGWDYVHLDGRPRSRRFAFRTIATLRQDRKLVRYARIPDGTVAQLVSAQGARKLLAVVPRHVAVDVDIRTPWRWNLDLYGVTPSPFGHAAFASAIRKLGGNSRHRSWTGSGYRSPFSFVFNVRKLGLLFWMICAAQMAEQKWRRFLSRDRLPPRRPH